MKNKRFHAADIARILVGLVLIATGVGKALDIQGFIGVVNTYQITHGLLSVSVGYLLPFFEIILGAALLSKWKLPTTARVAVLMHAGFTIMLITTLLRGIDVPNCGCFGVFLARPLTWWTVIEDLAMLALAVIILRQAKKQLFTS
jgi:hypothetical protein